MTAPDTVLGFDPVLRAVGAYGLPGSMLDFPDRPLDEADFTRLHARVRRQRMTGLLWAAISDGALPVTEEQGERALMSHLQSLGIALVLEHLLIQTLEAFERAAIPVRTLKGPATAHLDYPDPGMRTFGDIDLLVHPDAWDDAVRLLSDRGNRRRFPEPRPGFDRRFGKGASFRTPDSLEIDVHRSFCSGPFGVRLAVDRLWQHPGDTFWMGGAKVRCLGASERLLHAAYHAVLGGTAPRLMPLRDVAQIMLTHGYDLEWLRTLMRESGGEPVVARAVRWAWHELHLADVLALSAWADTYVEDAKASAELAVYGAGASYAAQSLAAVHALPSLVEKAKFVYALALPQRAYTEDRYANVSSRLRSGWAQIRQQDGPQ